MLKFKKASYGSWPGYQCYMTNADGSTTRIARINSPFKKELRGDINLWDITFVRGQQSGEIRNLLLIISKIKKLAKEYRDNE